MGHDYISAFFLEAAWHEITPFLKILIDFVFREGIFPDSCKIVRIAPIHKNGAKDETNNYRPISILTCFSKIIEKLIYRRLIYFFQKHHILYPNRFGFQSKTSMAHAMLNVVTSLYDSINRNQYSGLVLIDLKKAFDTVSYTTLLKKLHNCGIRGVAQKLLVFYLECRKEFVALNQMRSKLMNIEYSAPQGSTLGPLFFLIHINDLNNALRSKPIFFADDNCLLVTENNSQTLRNTITDELNRLSIWCSANKLTVNLSKTCILCTPPKLSMNSNFSPFFRVMIILLILLVV